MEKLSLNKQLNVIKQYFSGLSYREIAVKVGISTGAVANIIIDLKAGNFPEICDASEQLDALKEIATEVKNSRLTIADCVVGMNIFKGLSEFGLEPGDVPRCLSICETLTPGDIETKMFIKAAIDYQDIVKRTGLGVEDLDRKVKDLEKACRELEPMAKQTVNLRKELEILVSQQSNITEKVTSLKKQERLLMGSIEKKEQRESDLSSRITSLEERLKHDDEKLAEARKNFEQLSSIGISIEELTGFTERLKGIAHRYSVNPNEMTKRLLILIEQQDKELSLTSWIQEKQRELAGFEQAIIKAQETISTMDIQKQQLHQELSDFQARITDEWKLLYLELKKINILAKESVVGLKEGLHQGVQENILQITKIKNEALEVGKELGQIDSIVQFNSWLQDIYYLYRGEDKVSASQVRILGLILSKSILMWVERNQPLVTHIPSLKRNLNNLISEFEQWKPQSNSAETSKSLTTV